MINQVVANLIMKNEIPLVKKLQKVVAFNTRFPLKQEGHKCLFLLHVPLFEHNFELHMEDGSKKLVPDVEAIEVLKREKEHLEKLKQDAIDQLKQVSKFSKMGGVSINPPKPVVPELEQNPSELPLPKVKVESQVDVHKELPHVIQDFFEDLAVTLHKEHIDLAFTNIGDIEQEVKKEVAMQLMFTRPGKLVFPAHRR